MRIGYRRRRGGGISEKRPHPLTPSPRGRGGTGQEPRPGSSSPSLLRGGGRGVGSAIPYTHSFILSFSTGGSFASSSRRTSFGW